MRENSSVVRSSLLKPVGLTFFIFLHVVAFWRVLDAHGLYLVSEDHVVSLTVSGAHRDLNAVEWSGVLLCGVCCVASTESPGQLSGATTGYWLSLSLSLSRHHRPTLES